jgi:probable F420-dependent oxidoreductase
MSVDPAEISQLESLPIASLWVGGHVTAPHEVSELIVNLARAATLTTRVTVGAAALVLPLYNPAVVAKQVADMDRYSGGRIALGVAIGGDYPEEFRACGVPLERRGARLSEQISLLREFWGGNPVNHAGRFYHIEDARVHPPPLQGSSLPIIVAGRQKGARRRAALLGDGWMPYFYSVRQYGESVAEIQELARAAGRDLSKFGWYHYMFVLLEDDEERARSLAAQLLGARFRGVPGQDFSPLVDHVAAVGSVEQVTRRLQRYRDAGVRHFILAPLSAAAERTQMVARILREVVPLVV